MRLSRSLVGLSIIILLLTACSEDVTKREHADFQYLNYDGIELGVYPHDGISDNTYGDAVKSLKGDFVKWTATVTDVNSDKMITLQEENLPKIKVKLDKKTKDSVEVGDIVTVSGNLDSYVHGLFGSVPIWKMKNATILEISEQDKEAVMAYQQASKDAAKNLVQKKEQEKKDELDKIDKEAKQLEVLAAAESEAYEKHQKTPEGKKELLTNTAKKMGSLEAIDVRNDENYWVVEVKDSKGLSAKINRWDRVDRSASFFETIFMENKNIETVLLIWNADLHDLKGNITVGEVMEIELTAQNANSINWDNFNSKNLPEVADAFWELNPSN